MLQKARICLFSMTNSTTRPVELLLTVISLFPFFRKYYGPDSTNSAYAVDSCSEALGLATCAEWQPDPIAFLRLLTDHAPPLLGGWCLVGIMAATMSTADGAILALGTVMSNNLLRQLDPWFPRLVTPENLLLMARVSTLPLTIAATVIAAFYRTNEDHAAGATGYLLIVAFDVVFATVVVPLFGAFYAKNPSPRAALLSILCGGFTRFVFEFAVPKGNLLVPIESCYLLTLTKRLLLAGDFVPRLVTGTAGFLHLRWRRGFSQVQSGSN